VGGSPQFRSAYTETLNTSAIGDGRMARRLAGFRWCSMMLKTTFAATEAPAESPTITMLSLRPDIPSRAPTEIH
jgi:hypothetical protein